MEEKQMMTNEELESQLQSLRGKATIARILTYGCGAAMILCFITGLIPVAIVFIVLALVGGYQLEKNSSRLKKILSDNVISSVLKEALGDAVEYNPWGKINPGSMVFPFSYNCADGSDHIKAAYHGLNIELGDIELLNVTEDTDENGNTQRQTGSCLKGQWLICDFGKELAGEVYISERTKKTAEA